MHKCNYSREEYKKLYDYKNYRKKVWKVTRKQPIQNLENFCKRGRSTYHLDHIVSIKYGFINGLHPDLVGGIKNLRFIPAKENIQKKEYLEQESFDMLMYFIEEGNYNCRYNGT